MNTPVCPYCGEPMIYKWIADGGGDYGDSVCDIWECEDCDHEEEGDCIGDDYEDEPIEAMPPDEPPAYSPPARDMDDLPF